MSVELKLDATVREDQGKGASRRLRRAKQIPGILYGAGKKPVSLTFDEEQVLRLMREETFFSQILDVKVKGKRVEKAILKDLQRHPFKPLVSHMDLLRIKAGEKMRQTVPIHYLNQEDAVGVKLGGGLVHHDAIEIEVECLPDDLPEAIDVDIAELELGSSIHLSEIHAPEGVVFPGLDPDTDHDPVLVSIHAPRKAVEEDTEEEAGESDAGDTGGGDESEGDSGEAES
ncbi:50S ribosomal protein L25/general stress protein Ctc [Spiribacter salinus M19-40]|jgi:large subunit ribosomal protein L25|uniref:Large ribosomal subunit protein bL25 n=1 Tax=Spiribacter salinus M19-40 TaxID=1260251 RepID=R4VPS9_9GAMM|nr:50S ribosomal protein L25/general stress protein Ctc [Spiribacter salinus]AGM41503.1 50S ribosomal protein L25/general stress protein Ctc [Spiribacter salinus M19-40]MBY5269093.1 50S ribosomal protein L25/general stress protein Ctc [Spiribacter salinus]MDR9413814.1 50S ribosomal protein L25/general stress protein Ctc [Spiribacter sp.]MDR9454663.1 50S ribosomal protein L25/general stress protein Ctc [Spiribacter sp.]